MENKVIMQQGNKLQIKCTIGHPIDQKFIEMDSDMYQCGALVIQVETLSSKCTKYNDSTCDYNVVILARFVKLLENDNLNHTCTLSSIKLEIQNLKIAEQNIWQKIFVHTEKNVSVPFNYTFDLSFVSDIANSIHPFASLYEDTETDFKLCGEGGSVEVHKLILKASSPVLYSMLSADWKETSEGQITVADANKETLEHLKDYIYLNELPNTGIEQLLLIGSYLMMPDLVQKCIVKLLQNLDAGNIVDLIEFAAKFKVSNLLLILLNVIRDGIVSIDHLVENNLIDMCQATISTLNIKKENA